MVDKESVLCFHSNGLNVKLNNSEYEYPLLAIQLRVTSYK